MAGAWSNDQLNSLYIYAASGALLLSVDANGLYLANSANGSYFKAESRLSSDGVSYLVTLELEPPNSSIAGVTYGVGEVLTQEVVISAGVSVAPVMAIISPNITGKGYASIYLAGQSNTATADNSSVTIAAPYFEGINGQVIGQGVVQLAPGTYTVTTATTTGVILDYVGPNVGTVSSKRTYEYNFSGVLSSTVAGDVVGLQVYSNTVSNSLSGATLVQDFGQITIAKASTPQPWGPLQQLIVGSQNYLILAVRRVSGSGTCSVSTLYRRYSDMYNT